MKYRVSVLLLFLAWLGCQKKSPVNETEPNPNIPAEIVLNFPEEFRTDSLYTYSLEVQDKDGIDSIYFSLEAVTDFVGIFTEFEIELSTTQWDSTLQVRFFDETQADIELIVVDKHETPERTSKKISIPVSYASNAFPDTTFEVPHMVEVGEEALYRFNIDDEQAGYGVIYETFPDGSTAQNSFTEPLDTSYTKTFADAGEYLIRIEYTDIHPTEPQELEFNFKTTVVQALESRTLTFNANLNGVDVELYDCNNNLLDSGIIQNGSWQTTFDIAPGNQGYRVVLNALGVQKSDTEFSARNDSTLERMLSPTEFTISTTQLDGQYPNTSDDVDFDMYISNVDDDDGVSRNVPFSLEVLAQNGAVDVQNVSGNTFRISMPAEGSDVSYDRTLEVTMNQQFGSQTEEFIKEQFMPRSATYTQTTFDGIENSKLVIEDVLTLLDVDESLVESVQISSANANLSIERVEVDGKINYEITPADGFVGMANLDLYVKHKDGKVTEQTGSANFTLAPRMNGTVRIKDTVSDALTEGAVLVLDKNGSVVDSVYTMNGEVDLELIAQDTVYILAKPMNGGTDFGAGAYAVIQANSMDFAKTFPVATLTKYGENLQPTGETFTERELGVLYWVAEVVHGRSAAGGLFDGDTRQRLYDGEFHRGEYTDLVLADTTEYQDGRLNIMKQNVKDINIDVFINQIATLYDLDAPQVQDLEHFLYDTSNRPENQMTIASVADLGGFLGANATYGDDNYVNLHGLILNLTNMSDDGARRVAVEEQVPTLIYFSSLEADSGPVRNQIPSQYWATKEDTRMSDDSGFIVLSPIDVTLGSLILDEHMIPGTQVRNGLVMPKSYLTQEWNEKLE